MNILTGEGDAEQPDEEQERVSARQRDEKERRGGAGTLAPHDAHRQRVAHAPERNQHELHSDVHVHVVVHAFKPLSRGSNSSAFRSGLV